MSKLSSRNNKRKKFCVIMSVYNVYQYVEEAITCLIKQDIGFEENIQLIIVNDGSTDDSKIICKKYQRKYPNNILYIEKENGGQSSARNVGMEYVNASYVNFLDPDDNISSNTFSEIANFYDEYKNCVDMVTIPLYYFEGADGLHPKYNGLGIGNRIINLLEEPENFILSSSASFYVFDKIKDIRFDERLINSEDTKFNCQVLLNNPVIGYVNENSVRYNYRKRICGGSNSDNVVSGTDKRVFYSPIYIYNDLFKNKSDLLCYEKEIMTYELRNRLANISAEKLGDEEYKTILEYYREIINRLDVHFISESKWLDTIEKKVLFLNISGRSFRDLINEDCLNLSDRLINTRGFKYNFSSKEFVLDVSYNSFCDNSIDLRMISRDGEIISPIQKKDVSSPYDIHIGEFVVDITHIRRFKIGQNINEYTLCFYDSQLDKYHKIRRNNINPKLPICLGVEGVGPVYEGYGISVSAGKIKVWDDRLARIVTKEKKIEQIAKKTLPARLYSSDKKWILIFDRPEKAGDNGEALFEYIMRYESPDIAARTFYVINKSCDDYKRMNYKDHIIDFRSDEHLYKFINACAIYSSHNAVEFFYPFPREDYKYYADLLKYKFIWLQHGVTENDVSRAANCYATQDDCVIVATKWEKAEYTSDKYLYDNNMVIPTGFSRFDKFAPKTTNTILIAPTWRMYLVGRILSNGHNSESEHFCKSDFYKNYYSLLTDEELRKTLRKNNCIIKFVLHSGFSCYESFFKDINCDCVKLVKMDDFSYSNEISECGLFVTDYSSTAFDAAYLRKPIIYFQFDENDFYSKHYRKSTWDYRKNGFGQVAESLPQFKKLLLNMISYGFNNSKKYYDRAISAFYFTDNNNCKRIMDSTRALCSVIAYEYDANMVILLQNKLIEKELEINTLNKTLKKTTENCGYAWYCLDETRKSISYKAGLFMTYIPRAIRRLIGK